jgi:hypothetical protein
LQLRDTMQPLAIVTFNLADEFVAELSRAKPLGGFVRASVSKRPHPITPHVWQVSIECGFVRDHELVKFYAYVGDEWPGSHEITKQTHERANAVMRTIEVGATNLGVEVRGGRLEPIRFVVPHADSFHAGQLGEPHTGEQRDE